MELGKEEGFTPINKTNGSSSEVDTASRTSPASSVVAALTPTQRKISKLLEGSSEMAASEALVALMALEQRSLPTTLTAAQLEPKQNPRSCCHDLASHPPAWTAHNSC